MRRVDLTTKVLLGAITLLLAVIAFRPGVDAAVTAAHAQIGSPGSGSNTTGKVTVKLESRINYRDPVLGVAPMTDQGVFLVYTQNMVEVYRLDGITSGY